jgi:hypothetical protein
MSGLATRLPIQQLSNGITTKFTAMDCPTCGVIFAVTTEFEGRRRKQRDGFYCPKGHSMSFSGPSASEREAARLKKELDRTQAILNSTNQALLVERETLATTRRSRAAIKGHLTRLINKGVCPFCRRNFPAVRLHIEGEHPEQGKGWAAE